MIGKFITRIELIRISQSLCKLLKGSVDLNIALNILEMVPNNLHIRESLKQIKKEVLKGNSISSSWKKINFSKNDLLSKIISVGEQSGDLSLAFCQIYSVKNENLKKGIKNFLTILEPSMILFIDPVVGSIVFALMLTVYNISWSMV